MGAGCCASAGGVNTPRAIPNPPSRMRRMSSGPPDTLTGGLHRPNTSRRDFHSAKSRSCRDGTLRLEHNFLLECPTSRPFANHHSYPAIPHSRRGNTTGAFWGGTASREGRGDGAKCSSGADGRAEEILTTCTSREGGQSTQRRAFHGAPRSVTEESAEAQEAHPGRHGHADHDPVRGVVTDRGRVLPAGVAGQPAGCSRAGRRTTGLASAG